MGKQPSFWKKCKKVIGTFTGKSLKGIGYAARGIGAVAKFGSAHHEMAKKGAYTVADSVLPGIGKVAGTVGSALGSFFGGVGGGAAGASIGSAIGSASNKIGGWYKDELNAHKSYIDKSGSIWDTAGKLLIDAGDAIERKVAYF